MRGKVEGDKKMEQWIIWEDEKMTARLASANRESCSEAVLAVSNKHIESKDLSSNGPELNRKHVFLLIMASETNKG